MSTVTHVPGYNGTGYTEYRYDKTVIRLDWPGSNIMGGAELQQGINCCTVLCCILPREALANPKYTTAICCYSSAFIGAIVVACVAGDKSFKQAAAITAFVLGALPLLAGCLACTPNFIKTYCGGTSAKSCVYGVLSVIDISLFVGSIVYASAASDRTMLIVAAIIAAMSGSVMVAWCGYQCYHLWDNNHKYQGVV